MTEIETHNSQAVALNWEVNGLSLAGLAWGNPNDKPLLALHGWLDNAESFHFLAPLLEGFYVVALDLTGHGKSAKRSLDASYQIWDDLPEILCVLEALGWDKFHLLGHSRGAIISTLFASAFPEKISRLVLLDALVPPPVADDQFTTQLRRSLLEIPRLQRRAPRVIASFEKAVAARLNKGLGREAVELLVARNLRECDGGYTWTTDARLAGASAVKLTPGQIEAMLQAITMPALLMTAEDSRYRASELAQLAQSTVAGMIVEQVSGGHHFHMEEGVAKIAQRISLFLQDPEAREPV